MAHATNGASTQTLSLVDEFILTLLNEESGYFHQVPGWDLNCAVVGAALGELSLQSRIDTDLDSLVVLDPTPTGDPALDPILEKIVGESIEGNAQYWIERLAVRAEAIVDITLDRLVAYKILEHHDGDFWTMARTGWQADVHAASLEGTAAEFVTTRISRVIFNDEFPDPRDIIIICLLNTCGVLRFIFQLDEESEGRVEVICKMDLIGRAIAEAIEHSQAGPLFRGAALARKIPVVPLRRLLRSRHIRDGNLPALFAGLAEEYGPVFKIRAPFGKTLIFPCRASGQSLDPPERAVAPENQGVLRRHGEGLRRGGRAPCAGWGRSFPASQGHVAFTFPPQAGRDAGSSTGSRQAFPLELERRRFDRRNARLSSIDQFRNFASAGQCRISGRHR